MKLKNWFNPNKTTVSVSTRVLDPALMQRFKQMLHTQQIDIFINVLQLSLLNLQDSLTKVVLGKNTYGQRITLFDKKIDELYHGLLALNEQLKKEGAWESASRRSLLLTIFVFYRILFRDLLSDLSQDAISSVQDSYALIKRIPPQVIYQSGSEYWRLYELAALIYGDVSELHLNADLIPILSQLFKVEQPVDEDFQKKDAKSQQDETKHSDMLVEKISRDEHVERANQFIAWLLQNIAKRESYFLLNDKNVFIDSLNYEVDVLFFTENVFARYTRHTSEEVLSSLEQCNLFVDGNPTLRFMAKGEKTPLIGVRCDEGLDALPITRPCVIEALINKDLITEGD